MLDRLISTHPPKLSFLNDAFLTFSGSFQAAGWRCRGRQGGHVPRFLQHHQLERLRGEKGGLVVANDWMTLGALS